MHHLAERVNQISSAVTRIVLFLLSLAGTPVCAQTFITPIEHVIVVVQENRTTDILFQDQNLIAKGADIQRAPDAQPTPLIVCWNPAHTHASWEVEYTLQQRGRGFCGVEVMASKVCQQPACPPDTYVENTPSDPTIQPYWDIAEWYGFANYMFQTNQGPSLPAHEFLFSGTSAPVAFGGVGTVLLPLYKYFNAENPGTGNNADIGCIATSDRQALDIDPIGNESYAYQPRFEGYNYVLPPGYPCYEHQTLTDQLKRAGVSWKYYGYSDPASLWNTPNAIYHICQPDKPGGKCLGSDWQSVDLKDWDVLTDVSSPTCNLAAVSWVIPDGAYSDHPGGTYGGGGPDWVANIINAVGESKCKNADGTSYWDSTAILITWDDWGGFYDHVLPFDVLAGGSCSQWGCGYVYGFRVPLLVVSAYTGTDTAGYISGTQSQGGKTPPYIHDFGSILNFIQYVFRLPQGGIGPGKWPFADHWAPDYWANGSCSKQACLYSLSDFFHFQQSRKFKQIPIQTFRPRDYVNLSGFGGHASEPDLEGP